MSVAEEYVAAAYLVVFTLVLVYVAIMAMKLTHLERTLETLSSGSDEPAP